MRKVIIMSGVSGSGKSTYIQEVILGRMREANVTRWAGSSSFAMVSADHYFYDTDGVYRFDGAKLSLAHGECFRYFVGYMQSECEMVVVDNTNTTAVEISPYILGAQAFGYEAEIHTLMCESEDDVRVCAARNEHGVPLLGVMGQHKRLQERQLMPWWVNQVRRPYF